MTPSRNSPSGRVFRAVLAIALLPALASLLTGCPGSSSGVPDRTIVLTFDDGSRSHLELVAPLLKEYGFRATFLVTGYWTDSGEEHLSFADFGAIHEMGFEIGSHSFGHFNYSDPELTQFITLDLGQLESELEEVGVPAPTTFAWPGDAFGPEARSILKARGFRFARRGTLPGNDPGKDPPSGPQPVRHGPHYDPTRHDPLLIPSTLTLSPDGTVDDLRKVIAGARDGKIGVIQFHGVPDLTNPAVSTDPRMFRRFLDLLREKGCNVIGLGDLVRYVDPSVHPKDRLIAVRFD